MKEKLNIKKICEKVKDEKGSITLFVVVSMLFLMLMLVSIFVSNSNKLNAQEKQIEIIEKQYDEDMEIAYNGLASSYSDIEKSVIEGKKINKVQLYLNNQKVDLETIDENIFIEDSYGNIVKIPSGFGLALDSGKNVTEGIVIEDSKNGNQFVWVPVGNVKDGTTAGKKIVLGRYTFDSSGAATKAETNETVIKSYYKEIKDQKTVENTVAEDLDKFIAKTGKAGGYYIARYEASKGTGDVVESRKEVLPWVSITQSIAATKARAMDNRNINYTTDLINSLAWDTALVFIQTFDKNNTNYSNKKGLGGSSSTKTGELSDEALKINDMAGNRLEWSTETSTIYGFPCVYRGGYYNSNSYPTSKRYYSSTSGSGSAVSFRPLLYL